MNEAPIVRWWSKHGGWQFGRVISSDGITAIVERGGSREKVPQDDLREWPPPKPEPGSATRRPKRRR